MKWNRTGLALATSVAGITLVSCGLVDSDPPEVARAGGTERLHEVSDLARDFCHRETTFNGVSVRDTEYAPNEFRGIYVEEEGMRIRHVIVGEVAFENDGGGSTTAAYQCGYLQQESRDKPAVDDDLGILSEGEARNTDGSGRHYRELRDHLRTAHGVGVNENPHLEIGAFSEFSSPSTGRR